MHQSQMRQQIDRVEVNRREEWWGGADVSAGKVLEMQSGDGGASGGMNGWGVCCVFV